MYSKTQSALVNYLVAVLMVCTLALIPAQAQQEMSHSHTQTTKQQKVYSCPMHPDVKAKSKGKCPKCGMDLRLDKHEDEATPEATPVSHNLGAAKMNIP